MVAKIRQLVSVILVYGSALLVMAACQSQPHGTGSGQGISKKDESLSSGPVFRSADNNGFRELASSAPLTPLDRALQMCQPENLAEFAQNSESAMSEDDEGSDSLLLEAKDLHAEAEDSFELIYQRVQF